MGENVDERIEAIRASQANWAEHGDQREGNSILANDVPWMLKLIDQRAELVMFNAIPGSANLRVKAPLAVYLIVKSFDEWFKEHMRS